MTSDSALACLYGARIANLLLGILCVVIAIYLTPVYKWVIVFLAATPLTVFAMASASAEGLTNSVAFLFAAYALRLAFGGPEPVSRQQLVVLLILTAALSLVRPGYYALILLYLLVPVAKLGSRKRYWLVFLLLLAVAAGSVAAWHVVEAPSSMPPRPGVDPAAQARFILSNPKHFVLAVVMSMGFPPMVVQMASVYSGVLVVQPTYSLLLVPLYALIVIGVCFLDVTPGIPRLGFRRRLLAFFIGVAALVVVYGTMYLIWMPVGEKMVQVRPRFFIPVGLIVLLCLLNLAPRLGRVRAFLRSKIGAFAAVYFLLRSAEAAWTVWSRYYDLNS